jgi:hypothetical protein
MIPRLEQLERRDAPTGVANPQATVIYLGNQPPGVLDSRIVQTGIARVASSAQVDTPLPLGDMLYLKIFLFLHPEDYHGTDTVLVEVLPPGVKGPTDSLGRETTGRTLMGMLGGSVPVVIIPFDLLNQENLYGLTWELTAIQRGWPLEDPPGVNQTANIPLNGPGPDPKPVSFLFGIAELNSLNAQNMGNVQKTTFDALILAGSNLANVFV